MLLHLQQRDEIKEVAGVLPKKGKLRPNGALIVTITASISAKVAVKKKKITAGGANKKHFMKGHLQRGLEPRLPGPASG